MKRGAIWYIQLTRHVHEKTNVLGPKHEYCWPWCGIQSMFCACTHVVLHDLYNSYTDSLCFMQNIESWKTFYRNSTDCCVNHFSFFLFIRESSRRTMATPRQQQYPSPRGTNHLPRGCILRQMYLSKNTGFIIPISP